MVGQAYGGYIPCSNETVRNEGNVADWFVAQVFVGTPVENCSIKSAERRLYNRRNG